MLSLSHHGEICQFPDLLQMTSEIEEYWYKEKGEKYMHEVSIKFNCNKTSNVFSEGANLVYIVVNVCHRDIYRISFSGRYRRFLTLLTLGDRMVACRKSQKRLTNTFSFCT